MATPIEHIRNFCIIAHIDHGKSTLADRLIEATHTVPQRDMHELMLDTMELEQERGITIKAQAVRMFYMKDGVEYMLNLIDTPGHVDFTYEVSRSMAACEGAILVVDASQGIEAQTLANVYLAMDNNLEILPVINKIDLPSARPDEVCKEIEDVLGIDTSYAPRVSAKEGVGTDDVLRAVIDYLPAPGGDREGKLKALIFDSIYDNYKGALSFVRVKEGSVKPDDRILFMAAKKRFDVTEVGVFTPTPMPVPFALGGRSGLYRGEHQERIRHTRRRHDHQRGRRSGGAAARLQGRHADGVLRHLSGRRRKVRRPARGVGKAGT